MNINDIKGQRQADKGISDTRSAIWGGLMTVRAQVNGVQGVVLSGRCRDLQEQWASGFPVRISVSTRSSAEDHC